MLMETMVLGLKSMRNYSEYINVKMGGSNMLLMNLRYLQKGVGSSKNGRDSEAKRLGVKCRWSICFSRKYIGKTKGTKFIQVKRR